MWQVGRYRYQCIYIPASCEGQVCNLPVKSLQILCRSRTLLHSTVSILTETKIVERHVVELEPLDVRGQQTVRMFREQAQE